MNKLLSIFFVSMFFATPVLANLVISPGISYMTNKVDSQGGNPSEDNETRYDIRVGYILPMGLYLGAMYAGGNLKNSDSDIDGSYSSMGPTVGYYSLMGFYTLLTYHITGNYKPTDNYELSGAKGPQVDVGWVFPLTAYFSLGPQLTWRSLDFDKAQAGTQTTDVDIKHTSIAPYLSLWFMF